MDIHTHGSLQAIRRFDGSVRAPFSFGAWLSGLLKRMQDAERRRRDYEILMGKTERELSDIGLTRGDVIAAFEYGRWPSRQRHRG